MHTSNSQKPSMNHPQQTMGPWGLSICVFANMQDCHAPKTTNPTKLQKRFVGWVVLWSRHTYQFIFYYFVHP